MHHPRSGADRAPRLALGAAVASALVVVVSPFAVPGPVGASGVALGYLSLLVSTSRVIRWRQHRTQTEQQLWRGLRLSLWAIVFGVMGVWAATATALHPPVITAVLCAAVLTMMALTYLAVIRWTRPAPGGQGIDPDHVVVAVCVVVVMTAAVQVVSHLVGGAGLGFGTELPGVVAICCNLVVVGVLTATNRGSLRRGDPRPLLMATALVLVASGTAVLLLTPVPLTPWALLVRTPWPLVLAACAVLPEVPRPSERQDVVISTVTSYVVAAVSLPVLAVALLQQMTGVAVLVGLAALASTGRLLLDVRELRQLVANRRSSFTDELTGLPNRRAVTALLVRALVERRPVVVAVIDLPGFKEFNDSLGHAAGDVLLRTVAARLGDLLHPGEVVARLGGDEFVVVAPCASDESPAIRAAVLGTAVVTTLEAPVQLSAVSVLVGASTGTAVWPPLHASPTCTAQDDDDPSELAARLLRAADTAMYDAKRSGGGWTAHDPVRHGDTAGQLERVADLRVALAQRQLVLHHQPQVSAATGEPVGVEALVRWQHPVLGLLGPGQFLDLAETHGLMGLLTEEVLRLGVEQQAAWRCAGLVTRMSVNLPASALRDADLPRRVQELLARHGVPASDLVLEVTESALLRDPERSSAVVQALRTSGARVSIDDFGTGYSSLARLRGLPVDELKLDASFTHGLLDDERARTIVASTVSLAHALGLSVVAEGVEDPETLACLTDLGCDEIQGYLFARPMPADQLAAWWGSPRAPRAGLRAPSSV